MNKFWKKVYQCDHKNLSANYNGGGRCSTPYCSISEDHCLDCGVYISKCGCGCNDGMGGWPMKRILRRNYDN